LKRHPIIKFLLTKLKTWEDYYNIEYKFNEGPSRFSFTLYKKKKDFQIHFGIKN